MGLVSNWEGNSIQIMGSDRTEGSSPANVVVEFVLQIDEAVVRLHVKSDIPQNAGNHVRSDLKSFRLDDDFGFWSGFQKTVLWHLRNSEESSQSLSNTLEAKQIVPICGNFNLVNLCFGHINVLTISIDAHHVHLFSIAKLNL